MSLSDSLLWRYAPKRMTGEKIEDAKVELILKAAQLAPTSKGLQPFKLILIKDEKLKNEIRPIAYNQPQISEASHLIIFCAFASLEEKHIVDYIDNVQSTRNLTTDDVELYKNSLLKFAQHTPISEIQQWAKNQCYLAMGFALAEAALIEVDCTPMEGFDTSALNSYLNLETKNLNAVAILALGRRDVENDFLANSEKVRRPLEALVERL